MKHVDKNELLDRVDNDEELLADLVELFIEDGANQIEAIGAAISAKDAAALEAASHSFKGSSTNMAAGALAELAFTLEKAGRDQHLDGAESTYEELKREFEAVKTEMQSF